MTLKIVLAIAFFIIFVIIGLTIIVTNKAYAVKHEIDPVGESNQNLSRKASNTIKAEAKDEDTYKE